MRAQRGMFVDPHTPHVVTPHPPHPSHTSSLISCTRLSHSALPAQRDCPHTSSVHSETLHSHAVTLSPSPHTHTPAALNAQNLILKIPFCELAVCAAPPSTHLAPHSTSIWCSVSQHCSRGSCAHDTATEAEAASAHVIHHHTTQ
jgi:hypothetical protein